MKKTAILSIILALLLLIILVLFAIVKLSSGSSDLGYYTHTKTLCNTSYCQSYIVTCDNKNLLNKAPLTGAVIEMSENLTNLPDENAENSLC